MSYFLWIEDFENSPRVTASDVLGSLELASDEQWPDDRQQLKRQLKSQGVFVELSLQDGLDFIQNNLGKIDYVILDIDLVPYVEDDPVNGTLLRLLEKFHDHHSQTGNAEYSLKDECSKLKATAGYYLYTELLVEQGFPKRHILFCSNHGDNTKETQAAFKSAKIDLPTIYQKSDSEVKNWVKSRYENPYSRLRRGIIEGCQYLKTLPEDQLRFKEFIKESEKQPGIGDIHDYLDVLANLLPLRAPEKPEKTATLYKLFIRTLAHEWEAAEPKMLDKQNELFAFSWIMKMTRNWLAHSKVFEQLNAEDVTYLFIVNMRAMFDLGEQPLPYENHLLSLFSAPITVEEMKDKAGENPKKRNEKNPTGRELPLVENYAALLKKTGNTWQAINFHDALNNLQKNKDKIVESKFLIQGLYQTFWFLTSSGGVFIPPNEEQVKDFAVLNYQFKYFDYQKSKYLFELARHIYSRSF